jgi:biotin synthase
MTIHHQWILADLESLYHLPLLELIWQAQQVHQLYHRAWEIQVCHLVSVKTGGCPEDCRYCPQSARYRTYVQPQPLMTLEAVKKAAEHAIAQGATRICLGAAWREVREGKAFDQILQMIEDLSNLGIEVCCTLGLLTAEQARRLAAAGLYAYNHNLDTSESFYPSIVTTRSYQDRICTLNHVQEAGMSVCCGGILGMGESVRDRLELVRTLANRCPQPESVPINRLIPIGGTPLEDRPFLSFWEFVRFIALVRIVMPKAMVRLAAGRLQLTPEEQALCFLAGANSIFSGEKLLTAPNPGFTTDQALFELLGLKLRPPFKREKS